jgi:hypothetical protein
VASLLGIPTEFLANALTIRQIETKHGARAGTTYALNLNKMQVRNTPLPCGSLFPLALPRWPSAHIGCLLSVTGDRFA